MRVTTRLLLGVSALTASSTALADDDQFRILIIAAPSKYHYEYIPIARESLEREARLHSFAITWSNSPDALDGDLKSYAAVMMLNTPADLLSQSQRVRLESYVGGGGNAIVVHRAAIIAPKLWPWYERLVGRTFVIHPMLQTGVVTVADRRFPATFELPDRWIWSDEFYVTNNPYDVAINTVLKVDETSYDPKKIWPGQVAAPMGKDHPEAWYRRVGAARVFVSLLGHKAEMYRDPHYLGHLVGGIYWAATGRGEAR